eukprot:1958073-Pleurochrysis_carterae.AAC.1
MPKKIEVGRSNSTEHVGPKLSSQAVCAPRTRGRARPLTGPEPAPVHGRNRQGAGNKLNCCNLPWMGASWLCQPSARMSRKIEAGQRN